MNRRLQKKILKKQINVATFINSQFIFSFASIGILFIAILWLLHPKLHSLPKADRITSETFQLHFKEEYKKGETAL